MRAVVTVVGKDKTGIIAKVSGFLSEKNINILDISQKLMQDFFTMFALVDLKDCATGIEELSAELEKTGKELSVDIRVLPEEIF